MPPPSPSPAPRPPSPRSPPSPSPAPWPPSPRRLPPRCGLPPAPARRSVPPRPRPGPSLPRRFLARAVSASTSRSQRGALLSLHCSDEFSCYSGSSSSYSGASARSWVSDSAQRPVDPLRVLSVVASLRRMDPKVLAKATTTLLHSGSEKKQKGLWIDTDSDQEEDRSERSSPVASEGSTVTGAVSAGSTAKALRWLLKQEGGLRRAGTGGLADPYTYMIAG